jgi:NADPH:quinone reductase-like Zn-dependent oxidoreductase
VRLTGGKGVDVVLDPLRPTSLRRSYHLLRPGGRLIDHGVFEIQTGKRVSLPRALAGLAQFPFSTMRWWKLLLSALAGCLTMAWPRRFRRKRSAA